MYFTHDEPDVSGVQSHGLC